MVILMLMLGSAGCAGLGGQLRQDPEFNSERALRRSKRYGSWIGKRAPRTLSYSNNSYCSKVLVSSCTCSDHRCNFRQSKCVIFMDFSFSQLRCFFCAMRSMISIISLLVAGFRAQRHGKFFPRVCWNRERDCERCGMAVVGQQKAPQLN